MRALLLFLAGTLIVLAASEVPSFRRGELHGRDAYFLENSRMRVAALRGAGHIAELSLKSQDPELSVNPMRVPHYPTIEPWDYDPAQHDSIYGGGTNRILMSGYMGHLLNFPTFGGPSDAEAKAGLGNHGEALTAEWKLDRSEVTDDRALLWYSTDLPRTRYRVGRVLTLPADETVLYIEEWVENQTDFDRPAMWVQHVTFGPPFVEPGKTTLDMSAIKGIIRGGGVGSSVAPGEVNWPEGETAAGKPTDLRVMQPEPNAGLYAGYLMDPEREFSYFTMFHPDYRVLVGYVWRTADFPWIGDWQENGRNKQAPWQGKVKARGMEFGTTPFGGPMKQVVAEGEIFGTLTYRWIPARTRETVRYLAFLAEIPEGYGGVADVRVEDDRLTVVERGGDREIDVRSAQPW